MRSLAGGWYRDLWGGSNPYNSINKIKGKTGAKREIHRKKRTYVRVVNGLGAV